MLKPPALFIRALLALALSICSASVWAAPEPEEVEPNYYTRLSLNGQNLYFKSPQEAWAYYKPIRQAELIKNFGPKGHPDILLDIYETPASEQGGKVITINGRPVMHSVNVLIWNGAAYIPHHGWWISQGGECPKDTSPIETHPPNYQNTLTCRPPVIPHPDSCPNPTVKVGNPIYPATGRKQQTEADYSSPSGLSFSRIYRSDANGWTHNQHYAGLDLNSPALTLKPEYPPQLCYQGIGADTKRPYCFPYKRKNTPYEFLLQRPDGRLIRFGGPNGMDPPRRHQ